MFYLVSFQEHSSSFKVWHHYSKDSSSFSASLVGVCSHLSMAVYTFILKVTSLRFCWLEFLTGMFFLMLLLLPQVLSLSLNLPRCQRFAHIKVCGFDGKAWANACARINATWLENEHPVSFQCSQKLGRNPKNWAISGLNYKEKSDNP